MDATPEQVDAGQAVYTHRTLAIYDLVVLGLSNRFVWRCPTPRLLSHYDEHVTDNHLDVGVGTGYFLDRCYFPSEAPRLALMDLNADALAYTSQRVTRYTPEIYRQNVLDPITIDAQQFDSIAINYLLHCLPGSLESKGVVFDHLKTLMTPGGTLFGSTLLQGEVSLSGLARRLMGLYNRKGIFSNKFDSLAGLRRELELRFTDVTIDVVGCAALFSGRVSRQDA